MIWLVSAHFGALVFLCELLDVCGNRMSHILAEGVGGATFPVERDVIICSRNVPFFSEIIIDKSFLRTFMNSSC